MKNFFNFNIQRFATANDTIISNTRYNIVYADANKNYILNSGSNSTIYAGDNNDTISNRNSDAVYLDGGADDDIISVYSSAMWGWSSTIEGGIGTATA